MEDGRARGKTVLVLHGPNLNLLGRREPDVYGALTLEQIDDRLRALAAELGVEIETVQTNVEGELVDRIQDAAGSAHAIVINPAAYTPRASRSATPSSPSACRWWRCISPTSTPARNSGIARSSATSPSDRSRASGSTATSSGSAPRRGSSPTRAGAR